MHELQIQVPRSQDRRIIMTTKSLLRSLIAAAAFAVLSAPAIAGDDEKDPVETMMKDWEKQIRSNLQKDGNLRALAAKYPLVVIHSREIYAQGGYKRSVYSFVYESSDEAKHGNDVQIQFHNGGKPNTFQWNMTVGQQNLVVDLGKADFNKDPDPAKISIDHPGVLTGQADALEGHVYLEHVRDHRGNSFYVVLQVVAVDKESRYMAFIWRKLPGGSIVKQKSGKRIG
jgi:hypothetical protein